jgi:transcriptional regulator GlxA family with amidase domain
LARIVDVSGEHLRRLCIREFRHSPMHHVSHLRMQRAGELLVSTQRKVQDIARAVGYEDPFAFATAFKRHMKTTPTRFRGTVTAPLS